MDGMPPPEYPVTPVTVECVEHAAQVNGVPMEALKGVLLAEGGWPGLAKRNRNGSYDLGPMQINTIWTKEFAQHSIPMDFLRANGCANVMAGAWILGRHLRETKDVWKAVARYHSRTPKHQRKYLKRVLKVLERGTGLSALVRKINARMGRGRVVSGEGKEQRGRELLAGRRAVAEESLLARKARRSGLVALAGRGN